MMKKGLIGGVILVIVIAGGIFLATNNKKTDTSEKSETTQTQNCVQPAKTIAYCDNKFNSTTVKSGDSVTFKNASKEDIEINSNPHPVHTDNSELNIGAIAEGESKTVTLTKKGTWKLHNHLEPSVEGTITVQ